MVLHICFDLLMASLLAILALRVEAGTSGSDSCGWVIVVVGWLSGGEEVSIIRVANAQAEHLNW